MRRAILLLVALVLAGLASVPPAFAAKRVALVIGIDAYDNLPKLQKAVNDEKAVAEALASLGFEVVAGEKVFVLTFEQARDPAWVGRVFLARFDERATWLDQLRPALGEKEFFFEPAMREIKRTGQARAWGQRVPLRRKPVLFGHVEWD